MERIKRALKKDIWILLLDILAVNLAYYLALAFRVAVNNMGGIFGSPGDVPVFFSAFYRIAPIYTVLCIFILFIPFGLTLPFCLKRHPVRTTILAAAGFSMMIELVQFVFGLGLCETDDVIFNTLGAAFGTLAFVIQHQVTKYRTAR